MIGPLNDVSQMVLKDIKYLIIYNLFNVIIYDVSKNICTLDIVGMSGVNKIPFSGSKASISF